MVLTYRSWFFPVLLFRILYFLRGKFGDEYFNKRIGIDNTPRNYQTKKKRAIFVDVTSKDGIIHESNTIMNIPWRVNDDLSSF